MSYFFIKYHAVVFMLLCATLPCYAQNQVAAPGELSLLQAQKRVLEQDKKLILDQFQTASKVCWQKFAVNDCLATARREKYQNLAPLDSLEIQLNSRQRELKELERQERLSDKTTGKGNP